MNDAEPYIGLVTLLFAEMVPNGHDALKAAFRFQREMAALADAATCSEEQADAIRQRVLAAG